MATILVVDDHDAERTTPAAWLRRKGHRVLEAPDAEIALDLVRAEQPDLVLVDILMATLKGFLSALPRQTRFIFTAPRFLMPDACALAAAHGVSRVIPKPFELQEVLELVSATLAAPPAAPARSDGAEPSSIEPYLAPISDKLRRHTVELEQLAGELEQRLAECSGKLDTARAALEQEVSKRLWAEDELTHANQLLHEQAMRDVLTGLYNRRYLMDSFERELLRARRNGERLGVMIIDIDHFKRVNDTYGHAAGDAVLAAVAKYMLSLVRGEDILCRFGGEEFVLVQAKSSTEAVMQRAEKFRQGIRNCDITHEGRRIGAVTLSIGISMFPDHATSAQALLQAADAALYRAKNSGRNRVVMEHGAEAEPGGSPTPTAEPAEAGPSEPR
jgi:diguanylate cyclase (GGDEF)-like protein